MIFCICIIQIFARNFLFRAHLWTLNDLGSIAMFPIQHISSTVLFPFKSLEDFS